MNSISRLFKLAISEAARGAKHNRGPALLLWGFGVLVICGYYYVPIIHGALESVREFKEQGGLAFSAISTALFAGVLPLCVTRIFRSQSSVSWAYLISNVFFWAFKGVEVDLFYRLQAFCFGDGNAPLIIATKVLVDQLIYAPLLGALTVILFYLYRDAGFSLAKLKVELGPNWYWNRAFPIIVSNWFVWFPACVLIYLLPLGLQLPIQNLILCFWVLMMVFFTEKD